MREIIPRYFRKSINTDIIQANVGRQDEVIVNKGNSASLGLELFT